MTDNGKTIVNEMDRQLQTDRIMAEIEDFNMTQGSSLDVSWSDDGKECRISRIPSEEDHEQLEYNLKLAGFTQKQMSENIDQELIITLT